MDPIFTEDISPEDVVVVEQVGDGYFSTVHKTIWRGTEVAMKKYKNQEQSDTVFANETKMNHALGHHPRVVMYLGSCNHAGNRFLLFMYMPFGSVQDLLISKREFPIDSSTPPYDLVHGLAVVNQILVDASSGVLHCHARRIIHRDIAARNFLVDRFHRSTGMLC